jgi:hypothetical protein
MRDELTGISGGASASFGYDLFGWRRTKTVSSTTTQFSWMTKPFLSAIT